MKKLSTDVLVVGGGSAGCFAAISAARMGATVMLVEKNGMLGGTITCGAVNFPGLFHAWGKQMIAGPAWESILRCVERKGAVLPPFPYQSAHHNMQQIRIDIFTYCCILDEMCLESGVNVMLHAMVSSVRETDRGVSVTLAAKGEEIAVNAKTLIDATGDADALRLAGCKFQISKQTQPATLINDLTGYDPDAIDEDRFRCYVEQCYENGRLTMEDSQGRDLYKMIRNKRIHMHIDAPDAHTSWGRTALEIRARKALWRILDCLSHIEGLEGIRVGRIGCECGVRETVRIVGEKEITEAEYLSGTIGEDSVCHAFYPIDLHRSLDIVQVYPKNGTVPCVCYGSLVPKGARHMLVAGRCLSSDTNANSALRVQATCMATGQVVGVAAALCAKGGYDVYSLPMDTLKKELRNLGAIVPGDVCFFAAP